MNSPTSSEAEEHEASSCKASPALLLVVGQQSQYFSSLQVDASGKGDRFGAIAPRTQGKKGTEHANAWVRYFTGSVRCEVKAYISSCILHQPEAPQHLSKPAGITQIKAISSMGILRQMTKSVSAIREIVITKSLCPESGCSSWVPLAEAFGFFPWPHRNNSATGRYSRKGPVKPLRGERN